MLAVCARHGPAELPPGPPLAGGRVAGSWCWGPAAVCRASALVQFPDRSRFPELITQGTLSYLLLVGPVLGDIVQRSRPSAKYSVLQSSSKMWSLWHSVIQRQESTLCAMMCHRGPPGAG